MQKIEATTDYSIFKHHEKNRPIDNANLKKIIFSIKTNNMLALRPILVDSQMRVIDGQHRLEAAKALNVPVYYQVNENSKDEDIILLNDNQKRWNIKDYINYYCNNGNEDYIKYKRFCADRNLDEIKFLSYLKSGSTFRKIRSGKFKFDEIINTQEVDKILLMVQETIECIKRYRFSSKMSFLSSSKFAAGIYGFLKNEEVNFDVFLKKLTIKCESIKTCSDASSYITLFTEIYNWKNHSPIKGIND